MKYRNIEKVIFFMISFIIFTSDEKTDVTKHLKKKLSRKR